METLSKNLDDWYGAGNLALQKIAIEEYYRDFPGSVILDVSRRAIATRRAKRGSNSPKSTWVAE